MDKGKMIFVTGSAMSGKSRFAVSQFSDNDRVQYLCTDSDMDDKTLTRIVINGLQKDLRWDIFRNFDVDQTPVNYKDFKCFVLDNLADWIYQKTMKMFGARLGCSAEEMTVFVKKLMLSVNLLINEIVNNGGDIVIISAETGFSPAPFDVIENIYREALCTVNQRIANMSDEAYFSFSGLQLKVK